MKNIFTELLCINIQSTDENKEKLNKWNNNVCSWLEGLIIIEMSIFPTSFEDVMRTQSELQQVVFVIINKAF